MKIGVEFGSAAQLGSLGFLHNLFPSIDGVSVEVLMGVAAE
jgi:hypothetical protein